MVGRKREIETLNEVMSRKQAQFLAVYGRRRIGKTYLIRQYFKNKFTFYHTGEANVGMKDQLLGFRDSLRDCGHDCPLPTSWREAFRELRTLIERSADEKKVVFIDEMPWMDTPRSKFLSALEHFWNAWGSSRDDLVLIVCGSASSWIVNNILRNRGGLHNRITDQIHLMPFTLAECESLSVDLELAMSRQEICSLYMVFGGVPYYWGFLRKGESVAQNVDRLLFAENGKLRGEFDSMLSSLFKRDTGCRKIVTVLAAKGMGVSREELLKRTGMCDGKVFCETMDALEKCGFIRRYTAFGKKLRGSLYQLIDSFALFHLRFVAQESNPDPHAWTTGISSKEKDAWAGIAFERVCLLHVPELKNALGIGGVKTSVCSWFHRADEVYAKGAQIDLLIDRADQVVTVCEMKYASGQYLLTKAESERIDNKIQAFKAVSGTAKSVYLALVTTKGLVNNEYARKAQNVILLDQLFAEISS